MDELLLLIPTGSKNAVSRADLSAMTGMPDRKMRQAIEDLRHDGHVILNQQDGSGYFIPAADDMSIVIQAYLTNESRAKSILHYNKFLKNWIKEMEE